MVSCIGRGFALYGWLPSLCKFYPNEKIGVHNKHSHKIKSRPELNKYLDRIEWYGNILELIDKTEFLILSVPPNEVKDFLIPITQSTNLKRLIVDKPICETPEKSEEFIKAVEDKGIKICSSYLFIYTDWFKELNPKKQYWVNWHRPNNNPLDSWKHNPKLGGGKIFYLIHLLAVSTYFPNMEVNVDSEDIPTQECLTIIDEYGSRIENIYNIFKKSESEEDNRIPYLIQLLDDFENNYDKVNILMKNTNELWKQEKLKLN